MKLQQCFVFFFLHQPGSDREALGAVEGSRGSAEPAGTGQTETAEKRQTATLGG